MPFTPEEIESKEFLVVLRGYDKEEVGSFLRAVAADVRNLQQEATSGAEAPAVAPASVAAPVEDAAPAPAPVSDSPAGGVDPFSDMGREMASVLRAASDAAAAIRQKAEDESNERVRIASEEASGVRHAADEEAEAILAAARATRSDAADEAHRLRETASQEAAEVRAAAAQEAERLVEASLARRDRLAQEALELQRRLTTAQETLDTLLGIVSDVQIGPEPTDSNGSSDAVGGSDEGQGGEDAYAGASSDEYHGE